LQPKNQLAKQFLLPPEQLFKEISQNFPPTDSSSAIKVLVEAGPVLLQSLIDQGLIDHLYLTTNLVKDGENRISVEKLVASFELVSQEIIEETRFERYKKI
jgi:riboflavin biosynthesis pyrimidine reductase